MKSFIVVAIITYLSISLGKVDYPRVMKETLNIYGYEDTDKFDIQCNRNGYCKASQAGYEILMKCGRYTCDKIDE